MSRPSSSSATTADMIVIDLGTQPPRLIQNLRKGRGKLADQVQETIQELVRTGTLADTTRPVVVVVKERVRDEIAELWW
jgi:Family of unknown function (DUF6200)